MYSLYRYTCRHFAHTIPPCSAFSGSLLRLYEPALETPSWPYQGPYPEPGRSAESSRGVASHHYMCDARYPYDLSGVSDMADYIPPSLDWVRDQVELYESSGGTQGTTLLDSGLPCILVTHTGNKTGGIRKIPLMRVEVNGNYVLIGSMGGQPNNPAWVYNLRSTPEIQIRDRTEVFEMRAREVTDDRERSALWAAAVAAYPAYEDYQAKTTRKIPVFIAEKRA